jgi:DnaJ-domain-containing protein 1
MYCVIQEIELKKDNPYGAYKELEAYKTEFLINGSEYVDYRYRYTGDRFERTIRKAYKISIHHSYRENGKVKKKQWSVCTMSYYDLIECSLYDCGSRRIEKLSKELNIELDTIYDLINVKLDPLVERVQKEFQETEEYKTEQEHDRITASYRSNKNEFEKKYGVDTYDKYYDVFGELREPEKFEALKKQYEADKEYQRSYYESYSSNHNSYSSNSSYSNNFQSNYTDKEKEYLKKIYKAAAGKMHPDIAKDDGESMKFLNNLKDKWGI